MRMRRVRYAAVAAIVASVGLSASSGAMASSSASAPRWRVVGTTSGYLTTLVAPSPKSQWAFGSDELNKPMSPVALRHVGNRWVQAALPAAAKGAVVCAGASSPGNIWGFEGVMYGPFGANTSAALHLRSGHWVMRHDFGAGLFLTGCNVLSPTDVWAFGSTGAGPSIGTWHLNGSTWTHMTAYPASDLGQASVVSPANIWATGWDGIEGILAHWNGSSWKTDPSVLKALPKPSATVQVRVNAVTAISSGNLWVEAIVGRQGPHGTWHYAPQVVHWNGARWSQVAASGFGYFLPVAVPDTHGGWWSTGYRPLSAASSTRSMTYLLHGSRGHWVRVPLPTAPSGHALEVSDVVNVPGTRVAYAVGDEINKVTGLGTGVILKVTY
jgi:hypothetical protein